MNNNHRRSIYCSEDDNISSCEKLPETASHGPKLKASLQQKRQSASNNNRFLKGTALGFGAMLNTASQEFLNSNMNDVLMEPGNGNAIPGRGTTKALENIKEEVYLSKGGTMEAGNPHLQDHQRVANMNSPLVISPNSSHQAASKHQAAAPAKIPSSQQPSSHRNKAAVVSPEANSYESEYDDEEYDDEEDSEEEEDEEEEDSVNNDQARNNQQPGSKHSSSRRQ